ncbi:hypothetical protein RFI_26685 [Reticulomyxa filosa]|uniref:Uncharacterized protein n=1 Tax=Reticulomyxa filosa TaxID=46433 RepID=X6MAJ6_RETFI|nr:hypothetical protein RFI_26685 [Reticulomyxa filosa]|eukprot:ETO10691.1 hypothetical protein RFI_26685 [Reticulomyxa filosa]
MKLPNERDNHKHCYLLLSPKSVTGLHNKHFFKEKSIEKISKQAKIIKAFESSGGYNFFLINKKKDLWQRWYDIQVNVKELQKILDHDNFEMRDKLREVLKDDVFIPRLHLSLSEERELALRRLKKFTDTKLFSVRDFESNPRAIFAAHEIGGYGDGSTATKMTVQFNLFGGTVFKVLFSNRDV